MFFNNFLSILLSSSLLRSFFVFMKMHQGFESAKQTAELLQKKNLYNELGAHAYKSQNEL